MNINGPHTNWICYITIKLGSLKAIQDNAISFTSNKFPYKKTTLIHRFRLDIQFIHE